MLVRNGRRYVQWNTVATARRNKYRNRGGSQGSPPPKSVASGGNRTLSKYSVSIKPLMTSRSRPLAPSAEACGSKMAATFACLSGALGGSSQVCRRTCAFLVLQTVVYGPTLERTHRPSSPPLPYCLLITPSLYLVHSLQSPQHCLANRRI